ncbi:hypothetical protein BDV11DRAFT_126454 [Aspergillus similis]
MLSLTDTTSFLLIPLNPLLVFTSFPTFIPIKHPLTVICIVVCQLCLGARCRIRRRVPFNPSPPALLIPPATFYRTSNRVAPCPSDWFSVDLGNCKSVQSSALGIGSRLTFPRAARHITIELNRRSCPEPRV